MMTNNTATNGASKMDNTTLTHEEHNLWVRRNENGEIVDCYSNVLVGDKAYAIKTSRRPIPAPKGLISPFKIVLGETE